MPKEDHPQNRQIKVTDKRIFTSEGDIREEFRGQIKPAAEPSPAPAPQPVPGPEAEPQPKPQGSPTGQERRRTMADRGENPGTPFANFIEPLIAQAYMSLGLLRNPYQPQATVDPAAARRMIDIIELLKEKTTGNLTPEEEEFLDAHLGELKLAYVQRTKQI